MFSWAPISARGQQKEVRAAGGGAGVRRAKIASIYYYFEPHAEIGKREGNSRGSRTAAYLARGRERRLRMGAAWRSIAKGPNCSETVRITGENGGGDVYDAKWRGWLGKRGRAELG